MNYAVDNSNAVEFEVLDPRPASDKLMQDKIQEYRKFGFTIIGVEVTVPTLAALLDLNIDPQHGNNANSAMSTIKYVFQNGIDLFKDVPLTNKIVFCTVRPDLDSVGSMVLLWYELVAPYSLQQHSHQAMRERIQRIHVSDTFQHGEWKPKPLLDIEDSALAAIARCVADHKVSFRDRVLAVSRWLETGEEPEGYRDQYQKEQAEIVQALESDQTAIYTTIDKKIAIVQSKLRSATRLGYTQAPIVIAVNPEFSFQGSSPHKKYTVCQYSQGYVDLMKVKQDLINLELGWGGSPTILGSPQGVSSTLHLSEVVKIVTKHLL